MTKIKLSNYGSEYLWGAGCEKSAGLDMCVGRQVIGVSTVTMNFFCGGFIVNKEFVISIAAAPNENLEVFRDINMLKSGILYADKIELVSVNASILKNINNFYSLGIEEKKNFIEDILPALNLTPKQQKEYKYTINSLFEQSNVNRFFRRQLKKTIDSLFDEIQKDIYKLIHESHYDELHILENKELLKVHDISGFKRLSPIECFEGYIKTLAQEVIRTEVYPMFDRDVAELFTYLTSSLPPESTNIINDKAKHIGFSMDILDRLPNLNKASIGELLDIRKELDKPLRKFRSLMLNLSDDIKGSPFSEEFFYECHKVYHGKIAETVDEIDELCKENKYIKMLFSSIITDPVTLTTIATSTLSLFLGSLSEFPKILASMINIPSTSIIVSKCAKVFQEYTKQNKEIRQNQMYFYHKVSKQLPK